VVVAPEIDAKACDPGCSLCSAEAVGTESVIGSPATIATKPLTIPNDRHHRFLARSCFNDPVPTEIFIRRLCASANSLNIRETTDI
jgi:hypothetical protein